MVWRLPRVKTIDDDCGAAAATAAETFAGRAAFDVKPSDFLRRASIAAAGTEHCSENVPRFNYCR